MLYQAPAAWSRRQGASGIHTQAQRHRALVAAVRMAFGGLTPSTNPCVFFPYRRGHQPLHYHWINAARTVTGSAVDGGGRGERWACLPWSEHAGVCPGGAVMAQSCLRRSKSLVPLGQHGKGLVYRAGDCGLMANCWHLASAAMLACCLQAIQPDHAVDACKRPAARCSLCAGRPRTDAPLC